MTEASRAEIVRIDNIIIKKIAKSRWDYCQRIRVSEGFEITEWEDAHEDEREEYINEARWYFNNRELMKS